MSRTDGSSARPSASTSDPSHWDLKVKKEFVLDARPKSLPPLSPPKEELTKDDTSAENKKGGNKRQKRKRRPKDARMEAGDKLCMATVRGDKCPYGEKCRFGHDVKEYLTRRPDDIDTLEEGCPLFNLHGNCMFGAMCRLGSSHLNMATGENLTKDVSWKPKPILNVLKRDVVSQLRKKTYPFVTQRADAKAKKDRESSKLADTKESTKQVVPVDLSPLPSKERKLVDFSQKVYVAPLTTVGNLPYRRIMKKFGADITCGGKQIETVRFCW